MKRNLTYREQRLVAAYEKQQDLYVRLAVITGIIGFLVLPALIGGA